MSDPTPPRPPSFKDEMLAAAPSLRAFAMSLSGRRDRADDLVQETIAKAWANRGRYALGTNMRAWLFTILRNEFYSQARKSGREIGDPEGAFTDQLATHAPQHGNLDIKDFQRALDQLPDDQREAIVLVGASGFSYEEAADVAGCAVGTVKSRVSRARERLKELLDVSGHADYGPQSDEITPNLTA